MTKMTEMTTFYYTKNKPSVGGPFCTIEKMNHRWGKRRASAVLCIVAIKSWRPVIRSFRSFSLHFNRLSMTELVIAVIGGKRENSIGNQI
jgi:hypothetical protein